MHVTCGLPFYMRKPPINLQYKKSNYMLFIVECKSSTIIAVQMSGLTLFSERSRTAMLDKALRSVFKIILAQFLLRLLSDKLNEDKDL